MIQAAAYRPITADRPQSAEASLLDMAAAAGRIALRPSLFLPFAAVAISAFAILFALAHFSVPVAAIGEWAYLGVFLAEIDPAKVETARKTIPSLQHGRRFGIADPKAGPEHLHLVRGSA